MTRSAAPAVQLEKPDATYLVDAYTFNYPATGICFELDRFVESGRDGLSAEITVRTVDPLNPGVLKRQRLNLLAGQSVTRLAGDLSQRQPGVDWDGALIGVCELALRHWREGDPIIDLEDVGARTTAKHLIPGYLEFGAPNVFFAAGGSSKSFIALAMAISISTGVPVIGFKPTQVGASLYLDWEADRYEHAERLHAIKAGIDYGDTLPYPIYYRREIASLGETVQSLRRKIATLDLKLIIIDSMGHARGGEVKNDQLTRDLFAAARSLSVTTLVIDHVPKASENGEGGPIGSVYTTNDARNSWYLEKVQEEGTDTLLVALTHHKANDGRKLPKRALRLRFDRDEDGCLTMLTFQPTDVMQVPELATKESYWKRIRALLDENLRHNDGTPGLTVEQIADELSADGNVVKSGTVKTTLNRYDGVFVALPTAPGYPVLWTLKAARVYAVD